MVDNSVLKSSTQPLNAKCSGGYSARAAPGRSMRAGFPSQRASWTRWHLENHRRLLPGHLACGFCKGMEREDYTFPKPSCFWNNPICPGSSSAWKPASSVVIELPGGAEQSGYRVPARPQVRTSHTHVTSVPTPMLTSLLSANQEWEEGAHCVLSKTEGSAFLYGVHPRNPKQQESIWVPVGLRGPPAGPRRGS